VNAAPSPHPGPATSTDVLTLERAVSGRYALERELGRGGMGIVMLARDLSLERPVALKLLPALMAAQPVLRERFLREARTAAGLSHPNIVPIHAVEEHEAIVFIAMGFVDGETLAERVRRAGPLPPRETARILREVAWALAYAHGRGIVHRDIKPDNILIERGSGRALVTDFGIAHARSSAGVAERLTLEGQLLGTAAFMSPEQGAGEPVDGRSDLYALGGVGYYALTGHAPFEATTLEALLVARFTRAAPPVASARPDTPAALAAAIDRCLARDPHDRFASGEALAEALGEATGDAGAEAIALPVRSFIRAAEQTMWLASLVVVFTLLYGLPATRSLVLVASSTLFGLAVISIDLVRRARELLGEGFGPRDVRRGFEIERRAHAEEMRQLYDARRTAARRRTRRRAWTVLAIGAATRVALQLAFTRGIIRSAPSPLVIALFVLNDVVNTVSFVIALNTSVRAERRFFRLAAALWQSRFASGFFRVAGVGRGQSETPPRDADGRAREPRLAGLVPPSVVSRYPELPALLKQLDESLAALRLREIEITRALAESGGERPLVGGVATSPETDGAPTEATLHQRRSELLTQMRGVLEETRSRRTTISAALENVRIQLLRIGAVIGTAEDLAPDIEVLRALSAGGREGG
jgi:serine/threonine-protein kinase